MSVMKYKGQTYGGSSTDVSENDIVYDSADELKPESESEIPLLENQETTKTFAQKVSTAVKNIRYLLKMLGNTDISAIGDGTVTGAIDLIKKENLMPYNQEEMPSDADFDNYTKTGIYYNAGTFENLHAPHSTDNGYLYVYNNGRIRQVWNSLFVLTPKTRIKKGDTWGNWEDILTQVKGNAEETYRTGEINLTPADIGAVGASGTIDFKLGVENGLLYYEYEEV